MKKDTFLARNRSRLGFACFVLVAAGTVAPARVFSADRVVLCEEFTQLSGLPCEYAGVALGMLLDEFPDTLTLVQVQLNYPYTTDWGNDRFFNFYGSSYTPTACFDGVDVKVGASSTMYIYGVYRTKYEARQAIATDVTLTLSTVHITDQTYEVTARVCVEPAGTGKTMRVYIAQVLDHWPPSPTYHRNGLKQMASTADVTIGPENCQDVVRTFTFDSDSWAAQPDIRIVAWAQEPLDTYPAEVYQAAWRGWPLVPAPGDLDDDGDVDLDDYSLFETCFTGPDGSPVEPGCEPGDFDGDADIDCDDWDQFVLAWTEPDDPPVLPQCAPVPTVSGWGLIAFALLALTAGTMVIRQRCSVFAV